ncbi:MAG: hypothetical protein ACRDGQ_07610 [Candidatus Limnocylindrales bacterium]
MGEKGMEALTAPRIGATMLDPASQVADKMALAPSVRGVAEAAGIPQPGGLSSVRTDENNAGTGDPQSRFQPPTD